MGTNFLAGTVATGHGLMSNLI